MALSAASPFITPTADCCPAQSVACAPGHRPWSGCCAVPPEPPSQPVGGPRGRAVSPSGSCAPVDRAADGQPHDGSDEPDGGAPCRQTRIDQHRGGGGAGRGGVVRDCAADPADRSARSPRTR